MVVKVPFNEAMNILLTLLDNRSVDETAENCAIELANYMLGSAETPATLRQNVFDYFGGDTLFEECDHRDIIARLFGAAILKRSLS